MPRNMSFAITKPQVIAGSKTVTRRLGWWKLKPGETVNAVEKAMGFKKGEKVQVIRQIRIVSIRTEPLNAIAKEDCAREGFPEMTPTDFVRLFCKFNDCAPDQEVNRIEFEYL